MSPSSLTPDEAANMKAALKVLRLRHHHPLAVLARLPGVTRPTLAKSIHRNGNPSAGLAIRCARLAGVPIDDVLSGAFPKPGGVRDVWAMLGVERLACAMDETCGWTALDGRND